jgi:DNA modification methylase
MLKLLRTNKYNAGTRPSEHHIGATSFLKNNNGAIPSNVFTLTNTVSNDLYRTFCKERSLPLHPARMPRELAEFFIKFLTDARDLVLDPFAGSNTTGAAAEELERRWIAIEPNDSYIEGSKGRFSKTYAG